MITWAADGHVDNFVVVSATHSVAGVVDKAESDAEDGDVNLLLDALVLAGGVGQVVTKVGVLGEKLKMKTARKRNKNRNKSSIWGTWMFLY